MSAKPKTSWKDIMAKQEAKNAAAKAPIVAKKFTPMRWSEEIEPPKPEKLESIEVSKPEREPKAWSNPEVVSPPGVKIIPQVPLRKANEPKAMKWDHKTTPEQDQARLEEILGKATISSEAPVPINTKKGKVLKNQKDDSGKGGRE